ncbi:PfkB family carbohydrate kinase [Maricaulis sp.]|uniref:PfkB family carbohydrate kinase n=1 Tax=Maricaulis sp. TaxID=1486257 RepID=UPI00260CE7ED|nr:PfkB family carbohydrate kinase [Maricaulis sp.]
MTQTITVVGSVNLDLVVRCGQLPKAGETVLGDGFAKHPGGKGANQALAARRLGAAVNLIGCVGDDDEAGAALSLLQAEGVDLSRCRSLAGTPTGVAIIAVEPEGDNQIVVASGANARLTVADLPERIEGALIGQLETPVDVLAEALNRCSGLTSLNLAPAMELDDSVLARADLCVVNEAECEFYGRERLIAAGGLTALTLGARGAILFKDGVEIARARPPKIVPHDATGAGDTFVAALTLALLEGQAHQTALEFACAAGAATTLTAGAQPALPVRSAVEALMAANAAG